MKKTLALLVLIVFALSSFAYAKDAPKAKDKAEAKMCSATDKTSCFANAKEKKEFAKNCKYMCEKCGYYDKKGGDCPNCKTAMTKCTDPEKCKKMADAGKCTYCCKKCGTMSQEAGKCPTCGKKMKKCSAKECMKMCEEKK
jgi:hypothetical protein